MADFLLKLNNTGADRITNDKTTKSINLGSKNKCIIFGSSKTYNYYSNKEDFIISLGYVADRDSDSMKLTLLHILESFEESQIPQLKKSLIGQYIIIIRKGENIYIFSDFFGARNIFFSKDGLVVSSSLKKIEDILLISQKNFECFKFYEFISMRHILYPAWLGHNTCHKKINWLMSNEYLVIERKNSYLRIGSNFFSFDNKKQSNCNKLSSELISLLIRIIVRKEYKEKQVTATMTGGHDTRLVAAIATEQYPNIRYRIAISDENDRSYKDMKVAKHVSSIRGIPLDVYHFNPEQDILNFKNLTESMSPFYNHTVCPLLKSSDNYSIGFGGVFGTELFMPIRWPSIDDFIKEGLIRVKRVLTIEDHDFFNNFKNCLIEEFQRIKTYYKLSVKDDRDYIRLFFIFNTARYGSFILSAFNHSGYQLDPYGSYDILDFALKISPWLWGNHKRLIGSGLVQKAAMEKINKSMGRVRTYMHSRPMLPLTKNTLLLYLIGFVLQVSDWLIKRPTISFKKQKKLLLPNGYYKTDGWEQIFLERLKTRYNVLNVSYQ